MMGAPAMSVAGLVSASVYGEVVMRAPADGEVRWRTTLPAGWHAPMTNPAVADSLMVLGSEPGRWCVLSINDGERRFCRVERDVTLGFGHASPSVSGGIVVQSGIGDPDRAKLRHSKWRCTLFAFGCESEHGIEELAVVVGSDLLTGRRRWATELRGTYHPTVGHIAGTAVIAGDLVVVPLPRIGEVVALALSDGTVRWRSPVRPARGSVSLLQRSIFAATMDADYVVLDPATGSVVCRAPLPAVSDRAGLAVNGANGVLTLRNGAVLSAPVAEWIRCTALWSS
jgi:outer membrane protein assembly factor BamB